MAGFGKSSRPGKRGSSSSGYSSYLSTVSVVVLLAMCLLGFWMLTSSSIIPSQVTISNTSATGRLSRSTVTSSSSSSATDDNPGSLAEDAIKGDSEPVTEEEADDKAGSKIAEVTQKEDLGAGADVESRSESEVGEEFEENQHHPQQNTEEETSRNEEETQTVREQEQASGNEEEAQQQQIQENVVHDQQQEEHDSDGTTDGGQQQEESGIQREQQTNDEQTSSQEEQQMGNNGEENQQESQEQKTENGGDENQQLSQTETEENHDQLRQQQMEDGRDGSQSQSEQQEEGNDGSLSNSNQQLEDGGSETQPSSNQKMEEGASDNQSESQQLADTQGSSKDQQQSSQQQIEEDSPTVNSDETQQPNEEKLSDPNAGDSLPDGARSEVSNNGDGKKRPWATQEDHSDNEKERREEEAQANGGDESSGDVANLYQYEWELCNVTAGPDYIPCLDNQKAIRQLHSFRHFEHRERHCPEESPTCLVPLPKGYKRSIEWPKSRDRIWYNNVPHTKLAEVKGHQNWVKATGQYLTFPGGGTQFIHGALHYIDFIQQAVRDIAWGKHTRVILDVGCGVASFGGYLFERDVLAMSFAPKDEHEAQVQFALERGIPAISAVMGSQRLPFPGRVFDLIHCARCRVPWHADGGTLLLELNRVLRPGGYFVWSATPVYQKLKEDVEIWKAMTSLTMSMCWDLVTIKKDKLNSVAAAIYRKPISNECYDKRKKHNSPPMCKADDDPNAAWYIPLQACMHRVPVDASERGSRWPEVWPRRVEVPPYWLNSSQIGVYGKPAPADFRADYEHWKGIVRKSYLSGLGISWSKVRNVMDMRAVYGGFAAALKDLKVWVMNVVNIDSPDTLPIIYERGLFGIYHDWCESFSTYPRTYDLLHADLLFSRLKTRCSIIPVMAEVDRIVRPGGKLIVRDESGVVSEVENLLKSLHWEIRLTFSKDQEGILCAEKSDWRPEKYADSS